MGPYIGEEKSPIGMLSQVEQRTRLETIWVDALNPKVAGSNPVGPATLSWLVLKKKFLQL